MAEHAKRKRARDLIRRTGYKAGGHFGAKEDAAEDAKMVESGVGQHEAHMHPGKPKTKLKLKHGGHAEGAEPKARGDKKPRGKAGVKINIMVGKHPAPPPPPAAVLPPPPPGPPPGALAGGPPPGAMGPGPGMPPPGGMKRGGHAKKRADGGMAMRDPIPALKSTGGTRLKKGGSARVKNAIKGYPIDDGAGGGLGRLEKVEAYGAGK